jgi:hypothetical protein
MAAVSGARIVTGTHTVSPGANGRVGPTYRTEITFASRFTVKSPLPSVAELTCTCSATDSKDPTSIDSDIEKTSPGSSDFDDAALLFEKHTSAEDVSATGIREGDTDHATTIFVFGFFDDPASVGHGRRNNAMHAIATSGRVVIGDPPRQR